MIPSRCLSSIACAASLMLSAPASGAPLPSDAASYRTPPPAVAGILTAPRVPRTTPNVSADGARMILPDLPGLIPISVLAEPVDKLAGLEVLPAFHCTRGQLKSALSGFTIVAIASGKKVRAALPEGARVGSIAWSPQGDRLASVLYATGGAELWIVDAATGSARKPDAVRLNTVLGQGLEWTLDGRAIVCAVVPAGPTQGSGQGRIPTGPELRVGAGKVTAQRTSRDVLRTADDQQRFALDCTAQLARVPVDGGTPQPIGEPGIFFDWALSPDEQDLVVQSTDTLPLGFPYSLFPSGVGIWSVSGARVASVGAIPLNDRSAIASVARLGPRGWKWAPDGHALWFFSWQDALGADPSKAIRDTTLPQPGTDRLMRLDAPFTVAPRVVATSDFQFAGMSFTSDARRLVLYDGYRPRRRERAWWIDPSEAAPRRAMLVDRSSEGVYDDPGRPLYRRLAHDWALWTSADGGSIYLAADGFRKDGQRPFLDRMDLESGKTTRLYECSPDVLEPALALLSADGRSFVTSRQSKTLVPNYYVRTAGSTAGRRLSDYADPAPALTASRRMQFKFMRPDSVALNAEVVLPAGWKPGVRLPTIFWVYPNDYRSAAAASENRRPPNRFPSQSALNPEVLVTQGYAVMYPDLAVVGTNDRYVEEIRVSAKAALDEAVRRGFCDPARVGVGGHSYGAFSTANLLAHTDLFKAGTASDGAYNRTLTPFTFQAEDRSLWEARDTYLQMSPFLYADQIRAPLLLLHNLDDTNVGTFPLQSERMFEALNGLGKTVSLVEYPYEDHIPAARETVLDYWARVIEWFDRYVKGAPAGTPAASPGGAAR